MCTAVIEHGINTLKDIKWADCTVNSITIGGQSFDASLDHEDAMIDVTLDRKTDKLSIVLYSYHFGVKTVEHIVDLESYFTQLA
jgi:hypothetical protein